MSNNLEGSDKVARRHKARSMDSISNSEHTASYPMVESSSSHESHSMCSSHSTSSENVPVPEIKTSNINENTKYSQSDEPPLLPGEKVQDSVWKDVTYLCPYSDFIKGTLTVTNYKVFFKSTDREQPFILDVPLGVISRVEKIGGVTSRGDNSYCIELSCKDMRNLRFALRTENHARRPIYEKLTHFAFPLTYKLPMFALEFKEDYGNDGWSVFSTESEFKRQGVPNDNWRISKMNEKYDVIDTYPSLLCVPKQASDDFLKLVTGFRTRGRFPILSWIHPQSQATITRSSQPMVGVVGKRNKDDEQYIQMIMDANAHSNKL